MEPKQVHIDATNMLCPMPVIKTQNEVKNLKRGDLVEITCTDPGAQQDIPAWCRINDHSLISIKKQDRFIIITIQVGKKN